MFGGYLLVIRLSANPLVIARSVEQDAADSGVEPVTQFHALGFAQGVFVAGLPLGVIRHRKASAPDRVAQSMLRCRTTNERTAGRRRKGFGILPRSRLPPAMERSGNEVCDAAPSWMGMAAAWLVSGRMRVLRAGCLRCF